MVLVQIETTAHKIQLEWDGTRVGSPVAGCIGRVSLPINVECIARSPLVNIDDFAATEQNNIINDVYDQTQIYCFSF